MNQSDRTKYLEGRAEALEMLSQILLGLVDEFALANMAQLIEWRLRFRQELESSLSYLESGPGIDAFRNQGKRDALSEFAAKAFGD